MARISSEIPSGFNPNEESIEEEFQAAKWAEALARNRAVGKYPEMHEVILKPTKALSHDFYARWRSADEHTTIR